MAVVGGHPPPAPSTLPAQGAVGLERAPGVAGLAAVHPWAATPLGPADEWSPELRAVVNLVLASPVAMALAYGADLTMVYNDAYAQLLGGKHPGGFGQPAAQVFAELWDTPGVGDVIEEVYRTGRPYLEAETLLPMVRGVGGRLEQAFFTRGYSAVRDAGGSVFGVLTVAAETTQVTRRLESLGELTSALAAALTLDDVARVALRFAIRSFDVDHVAFAVDDSGGWRVVRRVRGEVIDEADERLPPLWRQLPADSASPIAVTGSTGVAGYVEDGRPLGPVATDRHEERIRALASLPLRTASLRGAFTFGYRMPHAWLPGERALLAAAAELVAQAAERARRFENQHGTAQLLQRSMLPEHLPELDRIRIAARYDVGVDGNAAGGDFYDAFLLSGGRLALVLGDVAGHDVHAAALMGQVRAALRALALTAPEPETVLAGLDRLVASLGAESRNEELFVTVVYGILDRADGRLVLASAGHPPPVIRRAARPGARPVVGLVDLPTGAPLGLGGRWRTGEIRLAPGDTVLLFSDGVVERRGRSIGDGFAALIAAVGDAPSGDPRNLCSLATTAVAGTTDDDAAVLAVEHAMAPSRSATMLVPAEPTGPGRVRHWMTDQLRQWQVPESVVGAAILCTSELTTNALLHAGTPAQVHIDLSAERLLVSVADTGTRGSVTRTRTDTLSSRGRGLGLIDELSDAWGTDPTVRGSTVWFELLIPTA